MQVAIPVDILSPAFESARSLFLCSSHLDLVFWRKTVELGHAALAPNSVEQLALHGSVPVDIPPRPPEP